MGLILLEGMLESTKTAKAPLEALSSRAFPAFPSAYRR